MLYHYYEVHGGEDDADISGNHDAVVATQGGAIDHKSHLLLVQEGAPFKSRPFVYPLHETDFEAVGKIDFFRLYVFGCPVCRSTAKRLHCFQEQCRKHEKQNPRWIEHFKRQCDPLFCGVLLCIAQYFRLQ
eukprot:6292767-Amphidinium_carterae.1